jgi:CheY-like chemotaxis protein
MLGLTKADPGQIERVLVNLALNARDAMPQGGSLTIKTLNELVETDRHVGQEIIPAGRYVTLTMKDTGCGIDQASLSRIFEPFFTTKERGRGTGLGLSSVHGIVKQHQGYIVADSEPGKGATFTIYLPMDADAPQADKPESGTQKPFRGTETVMVVEDEPQVGLLLSTKLRRLGYTVLCATNATDALKQADAHGKPIHLLVTDVVMPGMNGRELADALRASCPDISILFMSGYPDDVIGRYGVLDRGTAFLQKPFHTNTLAEKIRELLAAKSNQP